MLSGTPFPLASFLKFPIMASKSSFVNRSEIHPALSISLIGIRNDSALIWVSVTIYTLGMAFGFASLRYIYDKKVLKSFILNDWVTTICSSSNSEMKADRRAKDCLPLPPTPTRRAFPPGNSMILVMWQMCSMA